MLAALVPLGAWYLQGLTASSPCGVARHDSRTAIGVANTAGVRGAPLDDGGEVVLAGVAGLSAAGELFGGCVGCAGCVAGGDDAGPPPPALAVGDALGLGDPPPPPSASAAIRPITASTPATA